MTTHSRRSLRTTVALAVAQTLFSMPLASQRVATNARGCDLLSSPAKYNGKLVRVQGLVHSDYEHFDFRFKCKGYIQLETSESETDLKKFGFRTRQDEKYRALLKSLENKDAIGPTCIQCSPPPNIVHATIEGMFRCHYDFLDCSNISRMGDSSLVISTVKSVDVKPAGGHSE